MKTGAQCIRKGVRKVGNKNGNVRSILRIERVFRESDKPTMNTQEIMDALLEQRQVTQPSRPYANTVTMQQLGNLLGRNKQFIKVSSVEAFTKTITGGSYPLSTWRMDEEE